MIPVFVSKCISENAYKAHHDFKKDSFKNPIMKSSGALRVEPAHSAQPETEIDSY